MKSNKNPDREIVEWMIRLGIKEATGDSSFDSMIGKLSRDTDDTDEAAEFKQIIAKLRAPIPDGDKIITGIYNFCKNYFGPDRANKSIPDKYPYMAKLYSNETGKNMSSYLRGDYSKINADDYRKITETFSDWWDTEFLPELGISFEEATVVWRIHRMVGQDDLGDGEGGVLHGALQSYELDAFIWVWQAYGMDGIVDNWVKPWNTYKKWVDLAANGLIDMDDMINVVEDVIE